MPIVREPKGGMKLELWNPDYGSVFLIRDGAAPKYVGALEFTEIKYIADDTHTVRVTMRGTMPNDRGILVVMPGDGFDMLFADVGPRDKYDPDWIGFTLRDAWAIKRRICVMTDRWNHNFVASELSASFHITFPGDEQE